MSFYNHAVNIVELRDIKKKDSPLHYRSEYTATAVLEHGGLSSENGVAFSIEQTAMGTPLISARFLEPPVWPLVPAVKALKDRVVGLYTERLLP